MDQDGAHTLDAGPTGGSFRDLGSYVSSTTDGQAQSIFACIRPADNPEVWG